MKILSAYIALAAALCCVPAQAEIYQSCRLTASPPGGNVNKTTKEMGSGSAGIDDEGQAFIKDAEGKIVAETKLPCASMGYQDSVGGDIFVCANYASSIKAEDSGFMFVHIVNRSEKILWTAQCLRNNADNIGS